MCAENLKSKSVAVCSHHQHLPKGQEVTEETKMETRKGKKIEKEFARSKSASEGSYSLSTDSRKAHEVFS